MRSRRNRLALCAMTLLAATALVAAACGSDDSNDRTPTTAAGATAAATSAATKAATTPTAAATKAATTPAAGPTTAAGGASAALKVGETALGAALTDGAGMTLYIFDNDTTPGASACNAGCVAAWPPLLTTSDTPPSGVTGASGTFTVITREDGTKQIAYNGKPVYHFVNDAVAGDTKGDGVGGIWHIATP